MEAEVFAIVGAGQAGFQTASSLRQEGFGGRVVLIGDEPVLPYQRPPLSKSYLAGESGFDELLLRPEAFYEKQEIDLITGETVTAIDRSGRRLRLASGGEIPCDHVVLATGARFRPLAVPGAELDGVLPLRTLADADILRERLAEAREVVVIGAGFIGLEFAAVARAAGLGVHIVEVTHHPMGRVVSPQTSRFFTAAHIGWGTTISLGTGVARILGADGRVTAVETSDGRVLPADLVLVCIGVVPNAELAGDAGLAVENGIVVDQYLATGAAEIAAIGDCANFPTRFANGRVRLESVQNGVDQARLVAARIAGKPAPYDKVPWFWSDQADLKLQIAGITAGHDASVVRGEPESGSFSVFCFRDGRLIGVELVNRPADHIVARRLLAGDPRLLPEQAADESFDLKAHAARKSMTGDILIRGGLVIDGSGRPGEVGDVAVRDGRIAAVGRSLPTGAARVIEAEGLAVTPGFIDIKTHSDFTLPINPKAESKVRQGVTTEIIGHCGFSVAPILPGKLELIRDYLSASAPWLPFREMLFPEYLDTFPATAVNAGMLVGHHTLRLNVMGMAARTPNGSELAQMTALLEEGLRPGALGLSTGLFTPPSSYADRAEIVALCAVLKRHNAAYFTHIRDESNEVIESVEEAIDIARTCGVHVEIVHLKCSGLDNWGKAARILAMIEAARAEGLAIDCDAYPYAAGSNPLKNLLPQWVQSGGLEAMLARLALPETRSAHPRRDRARRAQQLGPHPVLGLRADLDLAASAAARRGDGRRDCGGARLRPDRPGVRLSDRRQGRHARSDHLDCRGRHSRDRALALGAGRV